MDEEQKQGAHAASSMRHRTSGAFTLSYVETVASLEPKTWSASRVEVRCGGRLLSDVATGSGSLDAVFNALNKVVGIEARLDKLDLRYAWTHPAKALPDVLAFAVVKIGNRFFHGSAKAEDIMTACARAYLDALERCHRRRKDQKDACRYHERTPVAATGHAIAEIGRSLA